MATVTLTLTDTSTGTIALGTTFMPAIGHPLTPAQMAAIEMMRRTCRDWGIQATSAPASAAAATSAPASAAAAINAQVEHHAV